MKSVPVVRSRKAELSQFTQPDISQLAQ